MTSAKKERVPKRRSNTTSASLSISQNKENFEFLCFFEGKVFQLASLWGGSE